MLSLKYREYSLSTLFTVAFQLSDTLALAVLWYNSPDELPTVATLNAATVKFGIILYLLPSAVVPRKIHSLPP